MAQPPTPGLSLWDSLWSGHGAPHLADSKAVGSAGRPIGVRSSDGVPGLPESGVRRSCGHRTAVDAVHVAPEHRVLLKRPWIAAIVHVQLAESMVPHDRLCAPGSPRGEGVGGLRIDGVFSQKPRQSLVSFLLFLQRCLLLCAIASKQPRHRMLIV